MFSILVNIFISDVLLFRSFERVTFFIEAFYVATGLSNQNYSLKRQGRRECIFCKGKFLFLF